MAVVEQPAVPVTLAARPTMPLFDVALMHSDYAIGAPVAFSQDEPAPFEHRFVGRTAPRPVAAAVQAPVETIVRTVAVPMPAPRPAELAALQAPTATVPAPQRRRAMASVGGESIFQKIFGRTHETATALSYAAVDGGVSNDGQSKTPGRAPTADGTTAVYDISARTVYMPDGTRLEAHSGLRDMLDDPRYVNVRMRGATPPHTYDLTMRESLFHGVQAIRLTPVGGEGAIYGRAGLLAHTYMLGPNGDSNGCVSFKDYDAFLRAFKRGQVKQLVVVARGGRSMLASNN